MSQTPRTPPESSAGFDLPRFTDRLPDLVQILRQSGRDLEAAQSQQTYLPYWEDVYSVAHNLKGVLKILPCPPAIDEFIVRFCEILVLGLAGDFVCRKNKEAGQFFTKLANTLDCPDPAELKADAILPPLETLQALYTKDVSHEERIKEVPAHLFYVNEFVSKKSREIRLLSLSHCVVEDEILLDEVPLWRTQLNDALLWQEFGRGLVVNFLPFLSSEGSRHLKVWAWIAAATHSRAALKQRVKEVMPKVVITKL